LKKELHMRATLVLLPLLLTLSALVAQTDQVHNHPDNAATKIIDGAVNPDQIRDVDAYRLVLVNMAMPEDTSASDNTEQASFLEPVGLKDNDLQPAKTILVGFRMAYQQLMDDYNKSAQGALANGQPSDIADFLKKMREMEADDPALRAKVFTAEE
jgi:hypothetical protein